MRSHTPAPSASVRLSALGGCAANASDRREVRDEVLRTAFATARGYRPAAVGGGSNGGEGDQPRAARRAGLYALFAGGYRIRTIGPRDTTNLSMSQSGTEATLVNPNVLPMKGLSPPLGAPRPPSSGSRVEAACSRSTFLPPRGRTAC